MKSFVLVRLTECMIDALCSLPNLNIFPHNAAVARPANSLAGISQHEH